MDFEHFKIPKNFCGKEVGEFKLGTKKGTENSYLSRKGKYQGVKNFTSVTFYPSLISFLCCWSAW